MNKTSQDLRHHILSEVHRLLSVTSAKDLLAASDLCKSGSIRKALEALAEEKGGKRQRSLEIRETRGVKPGGAASPEPRRILFESSDEVALLQAMLNSARLATRHDIMRFAQIHGLELPVANKDSRERVIRKLLKHIMVARPDRRRRIIKDVIEKNGRQTEGWAQVIGG